MQDMLYAQSSVLIAAILFFGMLLLLELGYRIGRSLQVHASGSKSQINAVQASVLGVLALLLGFTFSLALQRYDSRSEAVVDEANAIGTTYLRAQLLPTSLRWDTLALLRAYVDLRVESSSLNLVDATRETLAQQSEQLRQQLWARAQQAAEQDASPVRSGLFIQSLNDLIDAYGRRDAALSRHVPEVVLIVLFATFLMAGGILGYASGVDGHRPTVPSYLMVLVIVLLVFIIIDLDRPRRGLIAVNQKSLRDLQKSITGAR